MSAIKINNLLVETGASKRILNIDMVERDNRFTGATTGELLMFLGKVISEPNKAHRVPESEYGYHDRQQKLIGLMFLCEKLDLKCMVFNRSDLTVEFRLYSYYKDKYALLRGEEEL